VRPPHHPENEACCVWKNAAVKQPSVRSLPFKTKLLNAAVKRKKNRFGSNRSCALALTRMLRTYALYSIRLYEATCHHVRNCLYYPDLWIQRNSNFVRILKNKQTTLYYHDSVCWSSTNAFFAFGIINIW
jgi:hypothetical protein